MRWNEFSSNSNYYKRVYESNGSPGVLGRQQRARSPYFDSNEPYHWEANVAEVGLGTV